VVLALDGRIKHCTLSVCLSCPISGPDYDSETKAVSISQAKCCDENNKTHDCIGYVYLFMLTNYLFTQKNLLKFCGRNQNAVVKICAQTNGNFSGVTRVGDTRGSNWRCRSSIFSWKPGDLFCSSLSLSVYHYRFLLLALWCHPLEGVTPNLFLPVRPRFSTIFCTFAHNFFPSGVTPSPV